MPTQRPPSLLRLDSETAIRADHKAVATTAGESELFDQTPPRQTRNARPGLWCMMT